MTRLLDIDHEENSFADWTTNPGPGGDADHTWAIGTPPASGRRAPLGDYALHFDTTDYFISRAAGPVKLLASPVPTEIYGTLWLNVIAASTTFYWDGIPRNPILGYQRNAAGAKVGDPCFGIQAFFGSLSGDGTRGVTSGTYTVRVEAGQNVIDDTGASSVQAEVDATLGTWTRIDFHVVFDAVDGLVEIRQACGAVDSASGDTLPPLAGGSIGVTPAYFETGVGGTVQEYWLDEFQLGDGWPYQWPCLGDFHEGWGVLV